MEKVPITFAIFSYNQEKYIREAIASAFAQTYSPLEILLSDDHSADHTFDIMKEMAEEYHGPHTVILNRNPENMGLGGHLNRIMELASGGLVVIGAGDDISLPNRVDVTADFFHCHPDTYYLWSSVERFSENSDTTSIYHWEDKIYNSTQYINSLSVMGCSSAWRKDIWRFFGRFENPQLSYEDVVLALRGALLGSVASLSTVLVRYRQHENEITSIINRKGNNSIRYRNRQLVSYLQMLADLNSFLSRTPECNYDNVELLFQKIFTALDVLHSQNIIEQKFAFRHIPCYFHMLFSRSHHPMLKRIIKGFLRKRRHETY